MWWNINTFGLTGKVCANLNAVPCANRGEVVIRAELPGVKKDDLEVTLSEHTVTIEAHTTREEEEEKEEYYRREMSRGDFQRTLSLPRGVDEAKATASFADGVLELTLPKTEKTSKRKVKVD